MSVEIKTRNQLIEINNILIGCSFVSPSVEFRELSFIVKSKIKKLVIEKMEDIFKSEDPQKEKEFEKARFEFSKKYAVKDEDGAILYSTPKKDSFDIDPKFTKSYQIDLVKWVVDSGNSDINDRINKREKEKNEWLSKKIKLEVNKLPKIKDIPSISNSDKKFNDNVAYDILVNFMCSEEIKETNSDGEEVE
jgi:hypothetical protein